MTGHFFGRQECGVLLELLRGGFLGLLQSYLTLRSSDDIVSSEEPPQGLEFDSQMSLCKGSDLPGVADATPAPMLLSLASAMVFPTPPKFIVFVANQFQRLLGDEVAEHLLTESVFHPQNVEFHGRTRNIEIYEHCNIESQEKKSNLH